MALKGLNSISGIKVGCWNIQSMKERKLNDEMFLKWNLLNVMFCGFV